MTKLMTYKLTLALLLGFCFTLQASEPIFKKEITREVHETFDVSSGAKLGIQNKHGDISISTWNKNQIQIDVLIKVKTSNSEKGEKFLNAIEIDFESSSSKVRAKTIYPDQEKNWWSGWFGNNKNLDYEVHYTVQAPSDISTVLINKYGNISQQSIGGDSDVTNKYGDIFFEDVSGNLSLDLGYGKAKVGEVGNSKMQIKYSSLKLISVNNLEITTKYSNIKIKNCNLLDAHTKYDDYAIETVGSMKNNGKYDEFKIGSIDVFDIDTKYTDVNITSLNQKASFETKYGSVDIGSTGNSLEKINIQSKYTGYNFNISGDFHLDFDGSKTDLHVTKPYEKYHSEKDGSDLILKAYRGSKSGGASISAYMRYGGLGIN